MTFTREMPNYGFIMYVNHHYAEFDEATKEKWWQGIRELLDHEDPRLADPILYLLRIDLFEDRKTVMRPGLPSWRGPTGRSSHGAAH